MGGGGGGCVGIFGFWFSLLVYLDRLVNSQKQREGGVLEFAVSGFRYHCT